MSARRFHLSCLAGLGLSVALVAALACSPPRRARLTIQGEATLRSHQGEVWGECISEPGQGIRLYVAPADGSHLYWLQNDGGDVACEQHWVAPVRYGNPDSDRLPLDFTVFAVLGPSRPARAFPGTPSQPQARFASDDEFVQRLTGLGAVAIASVRQRRLPGGPSPTPACADAPVIVSPGGARQAVTSPVEFVWTPKLPMWLEIRRDGQEVPGRSGLMLESGDRLDLPPGRYEVKVRRRQGDACLAEAWFDVVAATR